MSAEPGCHPRCTIGPDADHPGSAEYRCQDEHGNSLPFPGEPVGIVGLVHVDWDDPHVIRTSPESFAVMADAPDPDAEPVALGEGWRDVGFIDADDSPFG